MNKRYSLCLAAAAAVFVAGCQKPVETAKEATPAAPAVPAGQPAEPGKADSGDWKIVTGPADAKVEVLCFYPMNEHHNWVKELNKKIAAKWPGKVRVEHIDWWTEEGGKVQKQYMKESCAAYLVDKKIVVKKSQALGGWTEPQLLAAIGKEVAKQYGGAAAPAEDKAGEKKAEAKPGEKKADGKPGEKKAEGKPADKKEKS